MNLIIHLGQHKTGSKALQTALYANRPYLAQHGFSYPIDPHAFPHPRPYEMNHHPLFSALRATIDSNQSRATLSRFQGLLADLFALSPRDTKTMILSAEDLFDMHTAHETEFIANRIEAGSGLLARELRARDCNVKLICYIRRQDHLLAAHYAQLIKGTANNYPALEDFYQAFDKRLETDAILQRWEVAFGADAISVIPYEKQNMKNGIVENFYRLALGLGPPSVTMPFPEDLEAHNISPSRDYIEYIRLLNRSQSNGKQVLPREYVLESSFRDKQSPASGITSWLSPTARFELLERYSSGNSQIASRFKLGSTLFQEPVPSADVAWLPYSGLSVARLLALDTSTRNIKNITVLKAGLPDNETVVSNSSQPLIIWVLSRELDMKSEKAAHECLSEFIGHPGFDSILAKRLDRELIARSRKKNVMIVLIEPIRTSWQQIFEFKCFRYLGINCISLLSNQLSKLKAFVGLQQQQ